MERDEHLHQSCEVRPVPGNRAVDAGFVVMLQEISESIECKRKQIDADMAKYRERMQKGIEENELLVMEIERLTEINRKLTEVNQGILNSTRYKLGDRIAVTAKNPLKLFLWPVWIFRLLREKMRGKR